MQLRREDTGQKRGSCGRQVLASRPGKDQGWPWQHGWSKPANAGMLTLGVPQDEVTVANPAPLDPAASRAEGAGAPGTDAHTGSDLAASVVADGVPGPGGDVGAKSADVKA